MVATALSPAVRSDFGIFVIPDDGTGGDPMINGLKAAWALAFVLAMAGVSQSTEVAEASDPLSEVAAASRAWDKAFNSQNLKALKQRYTADAVSMPPGRAPLTGRAEIAEDFAAFFQGHSATHATENPTRHLAGDTVIERAEYSMTIRPNDGDAIQEEGKHVVVYARGNDGTWRVMWEIWNTGR
jgi:uncharacterized protein (TIGR02246 family)